MTAMSEKATYVRDRVSVPPELMGKFNLIFYQSLEDAVFKALGASNER